MFESVFFSKTPQFLIVELSQDFVISIKLLMCTRCARKRKQIIPVFRINYSRFSVFRPTMNVHYLKRKPKSGQSPWAPYPEMSPCQLNGVRDQRGRR